MATAYDPNLRELENELSETRHCLDIQTEITNGVLLQLGQKESTIAAKDQEIKMAQDAARDLCNEGMKMSADLEAKDKEIAALQGELASRQEQCRLADENVIKWQMRYETAEGELQQARQELNGYAERNGLVRGVFSSPLTAKEMDGYILGGQSHEDSTVRCIANTFDALRKERNALKAELVKAQGDERERCAKIAESMSLQPYSKVRTETCDEIAAAIRQPASAAVEVDDAAVS